MLNKRPFVVTGLDIGSTRVSAVTAEIDRDWNMTYSPTRASLQKGVSRGGFSDIGEAIGSVSKVFSKLKEKAGSRGPGSIYVNISGQSIKAETSRGMIPLSMRGREITRGDIEKCVNVASTIQLPYDRDIIHKITVNFSVDDQPAIKNALGLYASRLACELYVISAAVNHMENIHKCVNEAGYDVKAVVYTGIADGAALLSDEDRDAGTMVLNVGATLTEASLFCQGVLSAMEIIPSGRQDARGALRDSSEFADLLGRIRAKMDEFEKKGLSSSRIVLTGGLAFEDGIIELLESKFPAKVRMGVPKAVRGDISSIDSIRLTTALGLVKYGEEAWRRKATDSKNIVQRVSTRVVDIFNNYF